jgi:predicted RNase H-like HicB family nuclease
MRQSLIEFLKSGSSGVGRLNPFVTQGQEICPVKHRLSVLLIPLEEGALMARCERVRATATGDTREEAIENLQEAIVELVREYGEKAVFQDLPPGTDPQLIEVAV